ncbi:hypothetical protein ACFS6H_20050 [Terrimonas rubra]|uniref:Uncharacterized protein n=1 Tax=Terrimonas rubra TaxID=1035890 RepID=A0ABW6A9F7_9BACT
MNFDDLFKTEPKEPYKMSQMDFFEKTKVVFEKIYKSYSQAWQEKNLKDDEYPEESVCDKCTGCGIFLKNGEEKDCFQNKEHGECFYLFCDYELVGMELETQLEEISDLLSVDEIVDAAELKSLLNNPE